MNAKYLMRFFGLIFIGGLTVFFLSSCSKAEKEGTAATGFVDEMVTLNTLRPIFGEAKDSSSGIYDAIVSDDELMIAHRFYTTEVSDIDDDIGMELAPKIEKFYKEFKKPDRIVFGIYVSRPTTPGQWMPYCSFAVTREIIKKADWTTLINKEFFKFVQDLKYSD